MEKGWVSIFESGNLTQIHMLSAKLANEAIETIILNKIDSMYAQIGSAELWVRNEKVIIAKHLIERLENETE